MAKFYLVGELLRLFIAHRDVFLVIIIITTMIIIIIIIIIIIVTIILTIIIIQKDKQIVIAVTARSAKLVIAFTGIYRTGRQH